MTNPRLIRTTFAVVSILIASIVVGGMIVFLGALFYRWLADSGSPTLAVLFLAIGSLIVGALIALAGLMALRQALQWPKSDRGRTPQQTLAELLLGVAEADPSKLVLASLGLGFALGVSRRLRRIIYRSLAK